ncbi:hypothetical protein J9303_00825 [Bacillaceae bacterium Marseille-Q3522]|nr:hypothetical protein [Bacillaceae bacterium Marseille-Q3522]
MDPFSEENMDIFCKSIYLPMLLTLFERDKKTFERSGVKLPEAYVNTIEIVMKAIQKDLREIKSHMYKNQMKVHFVGRDDNFSHYIFYHGRREEDHHFWHSRMRNACMELMKEYLKVSKN